MTANNSRMGGVTADRPNCNIMALNNSKHDIICRRREGVARYRLRGWTQRQIAEQLNVSVATVNRDLAFLQAEWQAAALATIDEHKTRVLAEIAEVKRRAHADGNLNAVLQAIKTEVDILGLDAPVKSEISGSLTWEQVVMQAIEQVPARDGDPFS